MARRPPQPGLFDGDAPAVPVIPTPVRAPENQALLERATGSLKASANAPLPPLTEPEPNRQANPKRTVEWFSGLLTRGDRESLNLARAAVGLPPR